MSSDHTLRLFTMRFPQGSGEAFLENELPVLAEGFRHVEIYPLFRAEGLRALPPNVEVKHVLGDPYRPASVLEIAKHWRNWSMVMARLRASAPDGAHWRAAWRDTHSRMRQALSRAIRLRLALASDPSALHYSYWSGDWATVLGLLRVMDPGFRFVSRMHGFDLFAERQTQGWPVFQRFHIEQAERVFVASQAGLDDLQARYPDHAGRFELARLGTRDHGHGPLPAEGPLHIVSCAHLVPLKRVALLAEALHDVPVPWRWTHIGDGPERAEVEALAPRSEGTEVVLLGERPNAELLDWYRRTPIDVFVHTSASEGGVPVALQEAASFGIPLLALDAGGVREIVNARTGVLLPHQATPAQLAAVLRDWRNSPGASSGFREGVRNYWSDHFRAEATFARFHERLLATLS
ncbi:MAG: glycosyltransferase [Flavobacteriales bacterium]|nr:glycosyltransferase [Flavobacteriales bacterium]